VAQTLLASLCVRILASAVALAVLAGCSVSDGGDTAAEGALGVPAEAAMGAHLDGGSALFRIYSSSATRIVLYVYAKSFGANEAATYELTKHGDTWSTTVAVADLRAKGVRDTIYYGYRAWGPNWPYDPAWSPGSTAGFIADVDSDGHRFNPNKLLLDPYALEMSHDPIQPSQLDGQVFASGPQFRQLDSAKVAPKGILFSPDRPTGQRPTRALKDEIIYEAHLRGLTKGDRDVPQDERGTYAGAARKAKYLRELGVTAIEFLPLQETQNDANDVSEGTDGDNYWGYMTLAYFAPDRRYAKDRSPGGPTRELQAMVRAFHDEDIKVYIDVVYNHTGEGGLWDGTGNVANVLSWRGLDNPAYYTLANDKRFSFDNTGVGGNFNAAHDAARGLVVDSLRHWKDTLGIDGFRFDLAPILGNACQVGCFRFDKMDPKNALNRLVRELPLRPEAGGAGADLIAEPWAIGEGTYQLGQFPAGWAEWNGSFRDTMRAAQNMLGEENVAPAKLATRFAGSSDFYADDGRRPWHSINFLDCHDGFTLRDVYSYDQKQNGHPWPFGPSDGGEDHNRSWNQGGDAGLQRQAARTGLALLMLSAGVPMIGGGDEMFRTQFGNNNAYNLDSDKNWIQWADKETNAPFYAFARRLIAFRRAHPALRPSRFFDGVDHDGNGVKDLTFYGAQGEATGSYLDDRDNHFLAFRLDGAELGDPAASIYVAYNGWSAPVTATLPAPSGQRRFYRVADTASWMEVAGNFADPGHEEAIEGRYELAARSALLLIEK
jgi:isoamylase